MVIPGGIGEIKKSMRSKQPAYGPGDLLLDWFDQFRDRSILPGIVPVAGVEGASEFYYRLFVPVFLPGIRRKCLEAVEACSIRLPCDLPCHFPVDFSVACLGARFAYRSRLWCIDEVGQLLADKADGDGFAADASRGAKGTGLRACGYALREIQRGRPLRWAWAANGPGVLATLISWARAAEAEDPPDASLPDSFLEAHLRPWIAADRDMNTYLCPGSLFCALQPGEWTFHVFVERSKSGRVVTTDGELPRGAPVCPPPSAFPQKTVAVLQSIRHYLLLPGGDVWIACAKPTETPLASEKAQLADLPGDGTSPSALKAMQTGQLSLYYTCDLIHWRRRLSIVLEEIASSLTPSYVPAAEV